MRASAICLVAIAATPAWAANSRVDSVVVYADRAQVTRVGTATCKSGKAEVVFDGLPTQLDERTLRGVARGKAKVVGVTTRIHPVEEDVDARVVEIRKDITAVDLKLRELVDRSATLNERWNSISHYGNYFLAVWGEEMRNARPDTKRWGRVLGKQRSEREAIGKERVEIAKVRRKLTRERDLLQRRLNHHNPNAVAEVREAKVAVRCKSGVKVSVDLIYVVQSATWHPEYDVRFSTARKGKVGAGTVELTIAAVIQQRSGEDWSGAKISLSTARPRLGSEAPKPAQLWVDGYEVGEEKVLVQATERRDKLEEGKRVADTGPQSATLDDRGTTVMLELPRRVTVMSDGRPYWFPVDVRSAKATSLLVTVPKLSQHVYQVVRLNNPAPYPLLPGRVHVYRQGTYIGDTVVKYRAPGEPIEMSLGIDDEIRVERIDLTERDRKPGFLSGTKHMDRAYRVTLTSTARSTVSVEIRERIPVSKVEDVRVELNTKKSTAGYTLDEHRGFVTWTVKLRSGKKKSIDLAYEIHLPKEWKVTR